MALSLEEQEKARSNLRRNLERLRSSEVRARDQACDELSDFFEYCVGNGYTMSQKLFEAFESEIRDAMEALLNLAVNEEHAVVIESSLHALASAVVHATGTHLVNWDPLVSKLSKLNEVEYALLCLAYTGEPKFRPAIAQFLQDARAKTRASAIEQLEALDRQINISAGQNAFASGLSEARALERAKRSLPLFQPSYVILGYYVQPSEMGERDSSGWQNYHAALSRLGLPDQFRRGDKTSG